MSDTIDILTDEVAAAQLIGRSISGEFVDSTITRIGSYAFLACSNLRSVSFPKVELVNEMAFHSCFALENAAFQSCTIIQYSAFNKCFNLKMVCAPVLKDVRSYAFQDCYQLEEISLPALSQSMSNSIFNCCFNLKSAALPIAKAIAGSMFNCCINLESVSAPAVTSVWNNAFNCCINLSTLYFPSMTALGQSALNYCVNLKSFSAPALWQIQPGAFAQCYALEDVSLPMASAIGATNFYLCYNLRTVTIGTEKSTVCSLHSTNVFYNHVGPLSIFVPDSLVSDYKAATNWAAFSSLIKGISEYSTFSYPELIASENGNYYGTYITGASFSESGYIGNNAFKNCYQLSYASLPQIYAIWDGAFNGCYKLENVYIPNVTTIQSGAFSECVNLKSISAKSVSTIGNYAFFKCFNLKNVSFPNVEILSSYVFSCCSNLQTAFLPKLKTISGDNNFYSDFCLSAVIIGTSTSSVCKLSRPYNFQINSQPFLRIYVPDSLVTSYQTATNWAELSSRIKGISQLPSGVIQRSYYAKFDFTQSMNDEMGNFTPRLIHGSEATADAQRTSAGLVFSQPTQIVDFGCINPIGKTFEYDVANFDFVGDLSRHVRLLMFTNDYNGMSPFVYRANQGYQCYGYYANDGNSKGWSTATWPGMQGSGASVINLINGKTVKLRFDNDSSITLLLNNECVGTLSGAYCYFNGDETPTSASEVRSNNKLTFGGL